VRRVEHPAWDSDLQITLEPDDHARLLLLAKRSNHFDFVIEERMVPVADTMVLWLMSSVTMGSVIATRRT